VCLATFLVSRALVDGAFATPFTSVAEILERPKLEDVDYVPLKWKNEFHGRMIFPMKYSQYNKIWNLVILAAGFREGMRPYSMRVGAGARLGKLGPCLRPPPHVLLLTICLTGALSGPLRNYVLSNTTQVYERSYQPRHVRENLAHVAFRKLVRKDEELFEVLQDASLSRDTNAPLCVSQEDLDGFNNRRDIRDLRDRYARTVAAASSNSPEAKRIAARIKWVLDWLCDLRVAELRKAYFEDVDKLRSLG
jgi:hypothetical protein